MNYRDYINSKANDYKQHLLNDLKTNIELANIVNSVFFPEKLNIQRWLEETEVKSFYEYDFKGDPFFKRICTKGEIDNIPSLDKISNILSKYTIFSFVKSDNYEEAVENTQGFYHLVQKDFYKTLDNIVFDRLKDYKRRGASSHFYIKRITSQVDLTLGTYREYMDQDVIDYTLPSLSIEIRGEGSINFETIDVRSLLFLPERSFLFFYTDAHSFTVDEDAGTIKDFKRKNDEPVIYYLQEEQKYMVTNSWENIDRYNKYIQIILELSVHYFMVFEIWLTQLVNESHIKHFGK